MDDNLPYFQKISAYFFDLGEIPGFDSFLTVNESRRLQGQRRFRRPRRLRRVYEVLTESTSNSDHSDGDDQDQNQESDVENHSGEARPRTSEVKCLKNIGNFENSFEIF